MDIKSGDRVTYDGVECEVLWAQRIVPGPKTVLLAELVEELDDDEEPTGRMVAKGDRHKVLTTELDGRPPTEAELDDESTVDPPTWYEPLGLSDEVAAALEGWTADEVLELGEAGLVKLRGIGKVMAAKILEAAGG